jgi:2-polyprenyl-3-methyl-5-hydroxy-6-metoxy-1,4-benzoquinol methylase
MKIVRTGDIDPTLAAWNDRMYKKHPTPYSGIAGFIERARVRTVLKLAAIQGTDKVLEIGCEAGRLLMEVPKCRRLVGADISRAALEDAAELFGSRDRRAELFQIDAQEHLPFHRGEFNVIICSETLEHVEDPVAVLKHIHSICETGTRIVVSVPIQALKDRAVRILKAAGILRFLFPGIEEEQSEWHLHTFSREKLSALASDLFIVERSTSLVLYHYIALMKPL